MTEKDVRQMLKQAGQGQACPPSPQLQARKPDGVTSEGEESFAFFWHVLCPLLPAPTRQHSPAADRKWTVDFSWPDLMLSVEIEGVGHRLSPRYETDIEKYNELAACGWSVLRITDRLLTQDPNSFIGLIATLVTNRTKMHAVEAALRRFSAGSKEDRLSS